MSDINFDYLKSKLQKKEVQEYTNSVEENPVVSICVQTYQHVNYIKQCLDGILMQETTFPFEILLGEDDSSDGTREICREYAKKYPDKIRLFLHHRENNIKINGTPTGRFNFLYNIFSAKGKYIALCEGDDYWTDHVKLQKQVDFLEENREYILHGGNAIISSNNMLNGKKLFRNEFDKDFGRDDFSRRNNLATATILFRNIKLNFQSNFLKMVFGDWFLYLSLLEESGLKAYRTKEIYSVYRIHEGGIMNSMNKKQIYLNHIFQIKENSFFLGRKKKELVTAINHYCYKSFKERLNAKKYSLLFFLAYTNFKDCGFQMPIKKYIITLNSNFSA